MSDSTTPPSAQGTDKLRLLAQQMQARRTSPADDPVIPAFPEGTPLPLSHNQIGLWLLDQCQPGSAVYNTARKITLRGHLDLALLREGLQTSVGRHSALRSVFDVIDGQPQQKVLPPWPFELPLIDLHDCPEQLEMRLDQSSAEPFDLRRGPLLRATVFRLQDDLHVLLIVAHHIIFDGYSRGVLLRELEEMYNARLENRAARLSAPGCQFRDFVQWQRATQDAEYAALSAFWRDKLRGAEPLRLPLRARATAQDGAASAQQHLMLTADETGALKTLAASEGCTLFLLLSAAFATLLYRHSGQQDLVIGVPAASRLAPATRTAIGYFVNTLLFRHDLSGQPGFRELLRRTRDTARAAYRHANLPFDRVAEHLVPDRTPGENPYIKAMLNYYDERWTRLDLRGTECIGSSEVNSPTSIPLTLDAIETPAGLRLGLRHLSAAFEPAYINALLEQYHALLQQVSADAARSLDDYSLCTAADRALLQDPSAPIARPRFAPVAEQIFSVSERTPDAVALEAGPRRWSYRELTANARRIGARLHAAALPRGSVVAVGGETGFGLISALLAVSSRGHVFLTLDPELPPTRRALLLREAGARFCIHAGGDASAKAHGIDILRIPAAEPYADAVPDTAGADVVCPDNDAAYIFFTSGSTDTPKAVLGTHQGLSHLLDWQRRRFDIGPADRVAQLTRLSFDAVLRDLFLPLTSGAALCLPGRLLTADTVFDWLAAERISVLHTTPSVARNWLGGGASVARGARLRYTFFSGEPLGAELAATWQRAAGDAGTHQIVNLYGPTETTLIKTCHGVAQPPRPGIQPIGTPLPQAQVFCLNRARQLCGAFEPGELVIRTPFSTLGYLNLPADAQQGFRPNPFGAAPPAQVYFSGDLGFYDRDGILHIRGRADDEIKVNGVRISPREVEAALGALVEVRACAVVGHKDADGNGSLHAFLVAAQAGVQDGESRIRQQLVQRLPPAMIPATFTRLDSLPLTATGKTDYRQLSARATPGDADHTPPASDTEAFLIALWRDLLQQQEIGAHSDFFKLGGNSIRAAQVMTRVNPRCGTQLHFRVLFEHPTPHALASAIEMQGDGTRKDASMAVESGIMRKRGDAVSYQGEATRPARRNPAQAPDNSASGGVMKTPDSTGNGTLGHAGQTTTVTAAACEDTLSALWREILPGVEITREADFFALGGHSLLAMQLLARVRKLFNVSIAFEVFFRAPTIAALAREIVQRAAAAPSAPVSAPAPMPRSGGIPVSYPQESIIFLSQLAQGLLAYNFQASIRFSGRLDVARMEQALDHLIARHEILRTTFHIDHGVAQQRIHAPWKFSLPVIDLRNTPAHGLNTHCQALVRQEVAHMFDIGSLPLLRWTLLRLGEEEHILVHVEHHLPHDGWSFAVFLREFQECYKALCRNEQPALPPLPIQFADYTLWQRRHLQGDTLRRLLDYWTGRLRGASPELDLPADYPRPAVQSFRGAEVVQELAPELCNALRALCHREGVTLYMAMLAAFYVLLRRYTRQRDIVIGTGVANRDQEATERLLGMLVNTIALRLDLDDTMSFRDLLQQVKTVTLEGYAHQDLPFERLVEELRLERDLSRNPLFQTMFSFHDSAVPELKLPDAQGVIQYLHNGSSKFDLGVIAIPWKEQRVGFKDAGTCDSITVRWEYATDLFRHATIERMSGHYRLLLEQIVADPSRPVHRHALTDADARRQLLETWNATATPFDHTLCVQSVFERQATATPDAIALTENGVQVSYAELNRRANRLAHHLLGQGIGAGSRVAIAMERSLDTVVAILGVIKAGAAYVPLDASYPPERRRFMLEDSRVAAILTHRGLLGADAAVPLLDLERDARAIGTCADSNPRSGDDPERLLYVIYTSGSTGTPKGVEVPHRAVNRLVQNSGYAEFGPRHTFLLLAPISFDASTFEIWGPLLTGGRCVVFPAGMPDYESLGRAIRDHGVTTLWLTASLFNQIIDDEPQTLAGVGQLLTGGEALSVDHIHRAQQALPGAQLINGYGPTENTTFTCCYRIPRGLDPRLKSIPIGRPIGNTRVYVLDEHRQCVPVGVPGELHTGGAGLALGYQNRPELSAERFIDDPFLPGAKLYRTGDLVRYLQDGNLEFLGRIDQQIKLRGFRIEPGEIEAVLRRHAAVDDCAVILREDSPGFKQLVAYVALKQTLADGVLSAYLRANLPAYMVPSAIVTLESLPLNANGKVERRALPAPHTAVQKTAGETERGGLEQAVAAIWGDVLGVANIGRHDNFFSIGGQSLLAIQVMAKINRAFQVDIPLRTLFEQPTVAALAREIEIAQLLLISSADDLEAQLAALEQDIRQP